MKNQKFLIGLSFLLAIMLFNCSTPSNLLQDGEYDEAVYQAIMNLQKRKKKKEKDIIVVEEAFRKITAKDMAAIESLKATGEPSSWVKINKLHNDIKERQDLIYPYLPLIATKTKYKADFRFVRIEALELDSRNKAADYYYTAALERLEKARTGNKNAARNAYRKFAKVQTYFHDFKSTNEFIDEAHEIGVDKVLFDLRDVSYSNRPYSSQGVLNMFDEHSLNDTWTQYYAHRNAPEDIDFRVEVDITEIDMSPERVEYADFKVTKELFKTIEIPVNNENGAREEAKPKVALITSKGKSDAAKNESTTGSNNDKPNKPKTKTEEVAFLVMARVFDTKISKAAFMSATVRFIDARDNELLSIEHLAVEEKFSNLSSTFRGDKRALPHDVKCRLNQGMVNIPRDSEMLLKTANQLKNRIVTFIRAEDGYVTL